MLTDKELIATLEEAGWHFNNEDQAWEIAHNIGYTYDALKELWITPYVEEDGEH